jgi:hypothetical protein
VLKGVGRSAKGSAGMSAKGSAGSSVKGRWQEC